MRDFVELLLGFICIVVFIIAFGQRTKELNDSLRRK